MILTGTGALSSPDEHLLPLLTMLLMAELGAVVNVLAVGFGYRALFSSDLFSVALFWLVINIMTAASLIWLGIQLWPQTAELPSSV